MTNEEKARELAIDDFLNRENINPARYTAAMEMAKWKDKWRITRNHYQEWAEEQIAQEKQKLIDKAAEWLRMTMDFFNNGEFNTEKFVNDFKQAMKGE